MLGGIIGGSVDDSSIGNRNVNVRPPDTATARESSPRLPIELQEAVAAEVAAMKAQAATFHAEVLSGTLTSETDSGYTYAFSLSSLLPIPDDTPGELHIGSQVHPCRIVAVQGLRASLRLAVAPARFIERATLVAQPWVALARLHAALGEQSSEPGTRPGLSAALFEGESLVAEEIREDTTSAPVTMLDEAQQQALDTALQRTVTVIAGPANSGKTHLLSSIAATCIAAGYRVLVLAPSNSAIDSMLRTLIETGSRTAYTAGEVLRSGCSADPAVQSAYPLLAMERAESHLKAELEQELAALQADRKALAERNQALRVLQKAVGLAQRAAEERDAVQAEVDALVARQEAAASRPVQPSGVQYLKERWELVWQQARRLTRRPTGVGRRTFRVDPERQRQEAYGFAQRLAEARRRLAENEAAAERLRASIQQQLAQYELTTDSFDAALADTEASLSEVDEKHRNALGSMKGVRLATRERARLVASTVSQALAAESLAAESFDVVLVDDAHRIPLPHLFWAAGLAHSRLVVTTEETALQPWHCAQAAVAGRWLGRSFVEYMAGLGAQSAAWVVNLSERHTLQPSFAEAVSRWLDVAGDGSKSLLVQAPSRLQGPRRSVRRRLPVRGHTVPLEKALGQESPLLLVDTGALKPWSEAIPQEGRMNIGGALAAVALAERVHAAEPEAAIAVVTPYAAQARILLHLARDRETNAGIDIYAPPCLPQRAADIVILDTVETPGTFTWSALDDSRPDSQAYALFSGVFSQARQRVMIVAHWKHVRDTFGARALLRRMLGEAVQSGWAVSASELVRSERAGALPRMPLAPSPSQGAGAKRSGKPTGWRLLLEDLQAAERHVTVWSPHLALSTVERLLDSLPSALLERGAVRVITLPPGQQRGQRAQGAEARQVCEQIGAVVEERSTLAASLVTVDDRLTWECTFPPLGAVSRGAEMRRVESVQIAQALRKLLAPPHSAAAPQDVAGFMPYTEAASLMTQAGPYSPARELR